MKKFFTENQIEAFVFDMDGVVLDSESVYEKAWRVIAEKLHVSTSAVSKWEQGTAEPSLECLIQICRLYEVSADFLLGLTDDDPFFT